MARTLRNIPNDELSCLIQKATQNIRAKESRTLVCHYCKRYIGKIASGSTGYFVTKCSKCKADVVIDLINMRVVK